MTQSSPVARLPSEFDNFLYASIGVDSNGMLLSVLSALARSDLDPWQEAARLAGLPEKYATASMTALIAALPGRPALPAGFAMIAARLVALLPRRAASTVVSAKTVVSPKARFAVALSPNSWAALCLVLMALALGAQWVAANNLAPTHADAAGEISSMSNSAVPPSRSSVTPASNIGQ